MRVIGGWVGDCDWIFLVWLGWWVCVCVWLLAGWLADSLTGTKNTPQHDRSWSRSYCCSWWGTTAGSTCRSGSARTSRRRLRCWCVVLLVDLGCVDSYVGCVLGAEMGKRKQKQKKTHARPSIQPRLNTTTPTPNKPTHQQEAENPNPKPTEGFEARNSPLSGDWRLVYTNAIDVLLLGLLPTGG